jgi:hypothetical protein
MWTHATGPPVTIRSLWISSLPRSYSRYPAGRRAETITLFLYEGLSAQGAPRPIAGLNARQGLTPKSLNDVARIVDRGDGVECRKVKHSYRSDYTNCRITNRTSNDFAISLCYFLDLRFPTIGQCQYPRSDRKVWYRHNKGTIWFARSK